MAATTDATWELVLKRNPVERLKQEKSPLGILGELPALIADGYERMAEEDMVRLKWWGLYHDKPKVGTFMLRIKLPGGLLTPAQLRAIGEISTVHRPRRRRADDAPERPAPLDRARRAAGRVRAARGAGPDDRRRLRRHGAQHHRLPRRRDRARRALRRRRRSSRRRPSSSTATRTTPTCRASTRSRSRPAATAATRPRSTASRSSASCTRAARASRCWPAAGSRRCRASRATSASSSRRRRRSRSCARSSTSGART